MNDYDDECGMIKISARARALIGLVHLPRRKVDPAAEVWRHASMLLAYPPRPSIRNRTELERGLGEALAARTGGLTIPEKRGLATALARLGRYNEALTWYEEILEASPGDWIARRNRAIALSLLFRNEEAVEELRGVISGRKAGRSELLALADGLSYSGRPGEAIPLYAQVLRGRPNDGRALAGLAHAELLLGQTPSATDRIRRRTARETGEFISDVQLGHALLESGDLDKADRLSKRLLDRWPDQPSVLLLRAATLARGGTGQEVPSLVARAVSAAPERANTHAAAALVLNDIEQHDEARSEIEVAIRLSPSNIAYLLFRAEQLEKLGRWADAVASVDEARQIEPGNPRLWGARAGILHRAGEVPEALSSVERGLEAAPRDAGLRDRLARLLIDLGRPQEALAVCNALVRDEPALAGAMASKCLALHLLGRTEQALACLREAILTDAADPWVREVQTVVDPPIPPMASEPERS